MELHRAEGTGDAGHCGHAELFAPAMHGAGYTPTARRGMLFAVLERMLMRAAECLHKPCRLPLIAAPLASSNVVNFRYAARSAICAAGNSLWVFAAEAQSQ